MDTPEKHSSQRFASVDVLRGVAIIWVVLFHLWGDLEYFPPVPRFYYEQLWTQVDEGAGPFAVFTAFTDLVFRKGFQGVPLFMMISGISLTIAAYRAGDGLRWLAFTGVRFRKLLIPYVVGVALTYGVIALIAWRQAELQGASFASQFTHGVTISARTYLQVDWGVAFASFTLLPRLLQDEWFFAPQLALWFVGLLAQYYLLFPMLFVLMRRAGVIPFLLLTLAITVASNAWAVHQYGALEFKFFLVTGWAPFRLFEFTSGMAIGWLLIDPRARDALAWCRHPVAGMAAVGLGLAAMIAGDWFIGLWTVDDVVSRSPALYTQSLALPLVTLGLACLALPFVVREWRPTRSVSPLAALILIGTMSYAILIVNDAMRLVASQLRVEGVSSVVWWGFLIIYVPVSVLLAWPLARVLGLMPRKPAPSPVPERIDPPVGVATAQLEPEPIRLA